MTLDKITKVLNSKASKVNGKQLTIECAMRSCMGWSSVLGTLMLVTSATPEEHLHHLGVVLERLNDHGLLINVSKSVFGVTQLDFWGIV